ncbi:Os09g0259701, partial [Oryza sativa Japonica Group]
ADFFYEPPGCALGDADKLQWLDGTSTLMAATMLPPRTDMRHLLHHPAGLPGQEERGLVVVRRRHAGVAGGQERAARHRDGGRAVRAPPLPRCRAARRYSPPPTSPSRRPSLSLSPAPPPPAPLPAASRKSATTPARERRERREKERMWGLHRPAAASPWLSRPGSGQPPSHTRTSALLQGRRRGKKR